MSIPPRLELPLAARRAGVLRAFFKRLEAWGTRPRLKPMPRLAGIIRRHLGNILNHPIHRLTNAVTDGLNAKINGIKYRSDGFATWERFKLAIDRHCGGLGLEPR